jgi:hypothetical protein
MYCFWQLQHGMCEKDWCCHKRGTQGDNHEPAKGIALE